MEFLNVVFFALSFWSVVIRSVCSAASCKDNDVNCHRWINFCASYPNIRKQCPLTCKRCEIPPPIPKSPSLFPSSSPWSPPPPPTPTLSSSSSSSSSSSLSSSSSSSSLLLSLSTSSSSSVLSTGSSYSFAPTRTTTFLNPSTPDINGTWNNNRTKTGSTASTTNATEASTLMSMLLWCSYFLSRW